VTASVTDEAGLTASCTFTVTVVDTTAPVLTCPADQTFEATSSAGAVVTFAQATAVDLGSIPTIAYTPTQGSQFPLGTTPVTATATDGSGNSAICAFQVTVRDTTPPTITVPGTQTFDATDATGAIVNFAPATATDLVSAPTVVHTPASGSFFPIGPNAVNVTATDAAGNSATGSFTVIVRDITPPVVTCPANQTFEATSASGATVTFTPATATDNYQTPTVAHSPAQGSQFALGNTPVTATATDTFGNTASCTFQVTVRDTTAPVITPPADQAFEATSASGATVTFTPATATDAVSTPTLSYSPANGSVFPLGITTVTVSATDGAGNSSTATF